MSLSAGRLALDHRRSQELLHRNAQWIPGGLASINRKGDPCIAFVRAAGARMWDADGNEYLDYHAGFAPYILGHSDPDVADAVASSLRDCQSNYGSGPTVEEGALAELFLQCVPTAEQVQFFNTGSEATAQALRIARAVTRRDHVVVMQGGYNGNQNVVAFNMMNTPEQLGGRPRPGDEYPPCPMSAGIPLAESRLVHAVEFNDLAAIEAMARKYEVAGVITEPVLQNIGVVKPQAGYLEGLRALADRYGFVLIFDEVKTGFRAGLGGYQELCGVTPDLSTFGKALANGYPIAALAGKRTLMELAISPDPSQRVLVAGTYNCHPVPVAASLACLRKLRDPAQDAYGQLERRAAQLADGQERLFADHGVQAVMGRNGSAHCAYFMEHAPRNWWEIVTQHDFAFDTRYRQALIARGVYHFPIATKQGSISLAHSEDDIDQTLGVIDEALHALKA